MKTAEAVEVLRKHNGELEEFSETLLWSLRPYRGIRKSHFSEIVKAIYFAAPLLNSKQADRDLVHTIWNLTRSARLWTLGPPDPMFHGREFITDDDKKTLDRWIYEVESITLDLLRGFKDWEAISGLSDEINLHDSIVAPSWLVPPFLKSLTYHLEMENHGGFGDDQESLCKALTKIGPTTTPAVPVLETVASKTKYPNVRSAAENAISVLTNSRDIK